MDKYACPEGCGDLVAQPVSVVERYAEYVILAPYPEVERSIALTAVELPGDA